MKRNFIDVGASYGTFSEYISKQGQIGANATVVAIEPIPAIAQQIKLAANLKVVNKAIAKKGIKSRMLNIASNSELSSFNKINPQISEEIWSRHLPYMDVVEILEVPCTTLEKIIEENFLGNIDFVKIDTQGNDLETLLSAGEHLQRIKSAMLEFPFSSELALYDDEIDLVAAINVLKKNNFIPVRLIPNGGGECNLFVVNLKFTLEEDFEMEEEYNFLEAPTLKLQENKLRDTHFLPKVLQLLFRVKSYIPVIGR